MIYIYDLNFTIKSRAKPIELVITNQIKSNFLHKIFHETNKAINFGNES